MQAWSDPLGTWWHDAPLKIEAGVDVDVMLEQGARLYARAAQQLPRSLDKADRLRVTGVVDQLRDAAAPPLERLAAATDDAVVALLDAHPVRELVTSADERTVWVDRARALYGAWYEFFPRSEGAVPDAAGVLRSGTFATAAERLPAVAEMGFDVVYLPPIHPIGEVNRKGPNNTLTPGPDDVGSPWAIGSALGGHDAVHPELGTLADFDAFVARTTELGMEVALDLALQCAPDHPWASEHPEWFTTRVDGTIAYAENPPKKYQDIYPLNFDNDPKGLYAEVLRVARHWMAHGVRIFRVDNPHTKPLEFWEWLIAEVKKTDPDVLFLAEAFTRPAMMHELGAHRLHAVLHLLHLAHRPRPSSRSTPSSWSSRPTTCGRTSSSTPLTSCMRRCSTAARRSSRSAPCWRRCCRRPTASTPATSSTSTSPYDPAARSTSTARSTSCGRATGARPERSSAPYLTTLNRWRRANTPRCTGCATSTSTAATPPTSWRGASARCRLTAPATWCWWC